MSDAPPFRTSPSLSSSEDDTHFNELRDGFGFGQQQVLPRGPYSPINRTDHSDVNSCKGHDLTSQPQFGYGVPDDPSKKPRLQVDTTRLQIFDHSWGGDSHLQNSKGLSPIPSPISPISPHSPAAMGSSDEWPFMQAMDDDDDEEAPQPEHILRWMSIRDIAVIATGTNVYIPQTIYQPYTEADRFRYVKIANLNEPIIFVTSHPDEWGISLYDALRAKMKDLLGRDDYMFENCGPSVSIRLQWPGYHAWKKQIPTMDFRSPKYPITKAKLAKQVANCVKRFIEEKEKERMEMEADRKWRVGRRYIRMEDLILVSLHHISKGSWQPQLRLRTPLSEIQQRRAPPVPSLGV